MEPTTASDGAIVIYGNDASFVAVAADALPPDHHAAVLLAGDFPEAALERAGLSTAPHDGHVGAESPGRIARRISLDRLDAEVAPFGDRVIAIVLGQRDTGDLAVAHAVKRSGGTVIAVIPRDVKPDRAMAAFIDLFLPPGELAGALAEMLDDPLVKTSSDDEEQLRTFLRQVRQRTGIDFAQYKMATIRRRLQRLMIAADTPTLSDFQRHLQQRPEQFQRLVHEFLIKVTDFFRDEELFDHLRADVLPALLERAREENGELRIWSAGCATGEEAYSLAILIAELLGNDLKTLTVKIFATDLDESAIAFARHGVYPRSALGAMPEEWIARYFAQTPRGFEVRKSIRALTVFGQHDLGQRAPFPRTDLILCRNVLIYFTRELQQRTLQLFAFSLRASGYLVLGKSETINPAPEYFLPTSVPLRVFRRHGDRVLIAPPRVREPYPMMRDGPGAEWRAPEVRSRAGEAARGAHSFDRFGTSIFGGTTGYVIVDRHYDVVAINAAGRRLLGIAGVGVGEDLVHLVEGSASAELRAVLDAGLGGVEESRELDMEGAPLAARRRVRVTVYPERGADGVVSSGHAMLRVEDESELASQLEETRRALRERENAVAELEHSVRRIETARDAFAVANQDLSNVNVELRGVNEHLLISIEEAESSTEEIETLNEEMQATNEELETLNEELQATIEELNTTNDELHVRGLELQAAIEERDRAVERSSRHDDASTSVFLELPIAVVHYAPDGTIERMTDAFLALLETYGDPLPLTQTAAEHRSEPGPLERAARGETFRETWIVAAGERALRLEIRARRLAADGRGTVVTLLEAPV